MRKGHRFRKKLRIISTPFLISGIVTSSIVMNLEFSQQVSAATSVPVLQASNNVIALENGDFEEPYLTESDLNSNNYAQPSQELVTGWQTTDYSGSIQMFIGGLGKNPVAASGRQYVELNNEEPGSLYQDVVTIPGIKVRWSVSHRGRTKVDNAIVEFGAPDGTMEEQARMSDGKSWGVYSGEYVIPDGQTSTRFQFRSLTTGSVGNYLDNVQFATQSILQLDGEFDSSSTKVRKKIDYNLVVSNTGGMTAANNKITVKIPEELNYSEGTLSSSDTTITNEAYNTTTRELTFDIEKLKNTQSATIQIPMVGSVVTDAAKPITSATYNDENFNDDGYTTDGVDSSVAVLDNQLPVITGEQETMVQQDASFDPMSTIQAMDTEDGDITTDVKVTGSVDTSVSGTYDLTYEVTDSDGNKTRFTRTVTVEAKPVITATTKETIQLGDAFDSLAGVEATDKEDGDLTSQISVDGDVDANRAGDYNLTYTVTDSDGNTTTLIRTITVHDNTIFAFNQAPEDLIFQTTEIGSGEVDILRQNPDWNLQIKDTRNNGEKWQVTATVNGPFVDVANPNNKQLHDALTYTKDGVETRLMDNQPFVIGDGTSNPTEITTIQYAANEGIHMKINPAGVKADSNYQTSITWTLNDTP